MTTVTRIWQRLGQVLLLLVALAAGLPALAGSPQMGGSRISVSIPNGYPRIKSDDFMLDSTQGLVYWSRQWNGQEWKFNPQWESLSDSWSNITGSQSAEGGLNVSDSPTAHTQLGGDGDGCWLLVDEDWQPSAALQPARSTPFNRAMGGAGDNYPPPRHVNPDYAALCPGLNIGPVNLELEALRRINQLFVGQDQRFTFNNRSVLEKRLIQDLPRLPDAQPVNKQAARSRSFSVGQSTPVNGYRWTERNGTWVDYDARGQMVAWGDRNNNAILLQRDSKGMVRAVLNDKGRMLLSLHYTGELLTEVKDYPLSELSQDLPSRSVKYRYDDKNRLTEVIDVRGNSIKYEYDAGNHITKVIDQESRVEQLVYEGNVVKQMIAADGGVTDYAFDYDEVNRQFSSRITGPETAAGRRVETLTHNRNGNLVRQVVNGRVELEVRYDTGTRTTIKKNARGFITRTSKNEFDQVTQVAYPDDTGIKRTYSPLHLQLMEETDELGVKTQFQYDNKGNLLKKTEAAGTPDERVTEYEVNSLGQTTRMTRRGRTERNGSVTQDASWQAEYDAQGHVSKTIDPESKVRLYQYNRAGHLVSFTNARNRQTRYEVDAAGNLLKVIDPLNHVRTYRYDKVGNQVEVVDARAKAVQSAYDAMNRAVQITNSVNGVFKREFDAAGQPVLETDEDGRTERFEYDNFMRLTKEMDGLSNVTQHGYQISDGTPNGTLGTLLSETEIKYPTFTEQKRFDQRERVLSVTRLNPGDTGIEGLVDSVTYDKRGNLKTTTDANGKTRYMDYDALGRMVAFKDSLGNTMKLSWDVRDNLIEFRDFNNKATRFEYDRNNHVTKEILPLGQTVRYEYDDNGDLIRSIAPNGNQSTHTYDDVRRRIKTEVLAAGETTPQITYSYDYDAEDHLTGWRDGSHTGSLSYNDAGWLMRDSVTFGAGVTLAYEYDYTPSGDKKLIRYPDGTSVEFAYEKHGELAQMTVPGQGAMSVNDWQWTMPKRTTLPGGTVRTQTYDGILNLKNLTVKNPGQQTLFSLLNKYNKTETLAEKALTDVDGNGASTVTQKYAYDTENRLTSSTRDGGNGTAPVTETIELDAMGNRVTHSSVSGTWVHDDNNRLLQRGDTRYGYDDNGNLVLRTVGASGAANSITRFKYDLLNRLTEVRDGADNLIAQYAYDPFDNRLSKAVYRENGVALNEPKRTLFLYSEEGLLAEADAAGSVTVQYGWKPDSEWGTEPVFIKTALGSNGNNQLDYAWLHNDQLGTPVRATNKAGEVVWKAELDTFGLATLGNGNQLVNNLRFSGQYYDAETGLHYNTRRFYDPQTGRYISDDPVGLDGGINRYAYVKGDPVNRTDPTGEFIPLVGVAIEVGFAIYNAYQWYNWLKDTYDDIQNDRFGCSGLPPVMPKLPKMPKFKPKKPPKSPCNNSFEGNTLVWVQSKGGDLQKIELKPISTLSQSDQVLAFSEWKETDRHSGADTRLSFEKVSDVISSNKQQRLVHLRLENGESITATDGHPFMTDKGWTDAILLSKDSKLFRNATAKGNPDHWIGIVDVSTEIKTVPVFNIEVANAHTFFIGNDGELVHNGFGSYTITFPDGTKYHGKGDYNRAKKSARRVGRKTGHYPCKEYEKWIKWEDEIDDDASFLREYERMQEDGGPQHPSIGGNGSNHNKRGSPGAKRK